MKNFFATAMLVMALGYAGLAQAAPVTFLGEDRGLGEGTRLTAYPNALQAKTNFFSHLTGVRIENFENLSGNTADFGNGLTATLSGGSIQTQASGTNGVGRYPISGNMYWEATNNFTLIFSEAISAFGFYGIDIGDFYGQVVLNLANNGGVTALNINNAVEVSGGGVLFFGFYDLENTYTSITFANTAAGTDYFAFDDFTIGTLENIAPPTPNTVPEPTTMLLLGVGLLGVTAIGRRRPVA